MDSDIENLKQRIKRHEGFRCEPYRCPAGYWTIGYGHQIGQGKCRISKQVADMILDEDIHMAMFQVSTLGFDYLSPVRRGVLVEMCFNLGFRGLLTFKRMLTALELKNYDKAADEMLDSKWAVQVGQRAQTLARIMRTGKEKP